jgi:hypothetical protein
MILESSIDINVAAEVTCSISILEDGGSHKCRTSCPDAFGKSEGCKSLYRVAYEILETSCISFILGARLHSDTCNSSPSGVADHKLISNL